MTAQSNSSQYEPLEPYDTMTGTAIAISDADEAEALSEYLTSPPPTASIPRGEF